MLGVGTSGATKPATPDEERDTPSPDRVVPAGDHPDPYADERDAWAVLAAIDRLGPVAFAALLAHHGTGRAVLEAAAGPDAARRLAATPAIDRAERRGPDAPRRRPVSDGLARAIVDATQDHDQTVARLRALGIRVVTIEEPAYPRRLAEIAMPPHLLFLTGDPAAMASPRAAAVVGTRRATAEGRHTAARIATALVAAGAAVVSGLAVGIDGVAHEAAIRAEGTTVAVIGGGHDRLSPPGHDRLAEAIVRAGGAVVSEHAPGTQPTVGTFPRRNRVISGLSEATIVVQAPARSGALITASWALEQGRGAFLVPGSITDPAAAGCLAFLREFPDEAYIVSGIPQLIADLGYVDPVQAAAAPGVDDVAAAVIQTLGTTESRVATALLAGQSTVDGLVAVTDLPVGAVLATISLLQRRGLVIGAHGRYRPSGALLGDIVLPRAG